MVEKHISHCEKTIREQGRQIDDLKLKLERKDVEYEKLLHQNGLIRKDHIAILNTLKQVVDALPKDNTLAKMFDAVFKEMTKKTQSKDPTAPPKQPSQPIP